MTASFKKLAIFLSLFLLSAAAGATQYSTTPIGNYTQNMYTYTTAYGQLFTLPTTQALQSFSFYLRDQPGSSVAGNIDLEITNWNASLNQATGPILYSSATPVYWNATTSEVTWNNINTILQGGTQYAIYMTLATPGATTQNFIPNYANYISAALGNENSVAGSLIWSNSNGIDPLYDPSAWNYEPTIYPAFQISATTTSVPSTSSSVPGPGTVLLYLAALLGIGALSLRRKPTLMHVSG